LQNKYQHIDQLLQQCKKGEQSAQFEVYKLYYKAMYNTALRILKDTFEAEDIMQESFLTAFSKLSTFKSQSRFGDENVPFGSWLKRIVINKSLTQLKKNKRLEQWNDETKTSKLEVEDSVNETDYHSVKVEKILSAIKSLKSNYSVILTLSLIEGFDNEEIANILKTNNQQVRTTISRAKAKLRKVLENKD
jgi:RNA polymerase sigma-70 factor (ECF subfamily)